MTSRGVGRMRHPSKNPKVTIGLSLSTEPHALSADTNEPFHIITTARILETPQPESPITLATHLTPLKELTYRSYTNIVRVDSGVIENPSPHPRVPGLLPPGPPWTGNPRDVSNTTDDSMRLKVIELWPGYWRNYLPLMPNLKTHGGFVTIPSPGNGALSVKFEVSRESIKAANIKPGERYRVSLTDSYLEIDWWGFGDFKGKRLRFWESPENRTSIEELEKYYRDLEWWDYADNIKDGEGDWETGENAGELAFVVEEDGRAGVVEFDIVE